MTNEEVPSVNPKLDAMCEMLKIIHDLNERNKMLEEQIEKMKRCKICKHYQSGSCNYHSNWVKDCKENGMKLFELKEIKEK